MVIAFDVLTTETVGGERPDRKSSVEHR